MNEIYKKISELERMVMDFSRKNSDLISNNQYLKKSLIDSESRLNEIGKLYKELESENKRLKVVSAISGNDEHKKVMKLQMNKLIREIDTCITELNNK